MIDATTAIIIVGLLAIGYAVRELDPNARTPEQAEREADEARREQQARQERRRVTADH